MLVCFLTAIPQGKAGLQAAVLDTLIASAARKLPGYAALVGLTDHVLKCQGTDDSHHCNQ